MILFTYRNRILLRPIAAGPQQGNGRGERETVRPVWFSWSFLRAHLVSYRFYERDRSTTTTTTLLWFDSGCFFFFFIHDFHVVRIPEHNGNGRSFDRRNKTFGGKQMSWWPFWRTCTGETGVRCVVLSVHSSGDGSDATSERTLRRYYCSKTKKKKTKINEWTTRAQKGQRESSGFCGNLRRAWYATPQTSFERKKVAG